VSENRIIQFVREDCCNCGVIFMVTDEYQERFIRTKKTFHCPNGHGMSYTGESDKKKLARTVKAHRTEIDRCTVRGNRLERDLQHQTHRANGYKGALTKLKNSLEVEG